MRRRGWASCAVVLLALVGHAVPASAAWTEREVVAPTAGVEARPAVSMGPDGSAAAAWVHEGTDPAMRGRLAVALSAPSEGFGASEIISPPGRWVHDPRIASGPSGAAFAVWTWTSSDSVGFSTSYRPPGGAWEPARDLEDASVRDAFGIGFDSAGNLTMVWLERRADRSANQFSFRFDFATRSAATGFWREGNAIDMGLGPSTGSFRPTYSFGPNGDVVVLFKNPDESPAAMVRKGTSAAFEPPRSLSPTPTGATEVQLATGRDGGTAALFHVYGEDWRTARDLVAIRPPGGDFAAPEVVRQPAAHRAAATGVGGTTVAHVGTDGNDLYTGRLTVRERTTAGAWADERVIASAPHLSTDDIVLARDDDGGTYAVMSGRDPDTLIPSWRATSVPRGGSDAEVQTVSRPDSSYRGLGKPSLVAGPAGRAVIVWTELDDGVWRVMASRWTSTPRPPRDTTREPPTPPPPAAVSSSLQADASHTGYVQGSGVSGHLTQAWKVAATTNSYYPVMGDGRVYALRRTAASEPLVAVALDPVDGREIWRSGVLEAPDDSWDGGALAFGRGTLVVAMNGQVAAVSGRTGAVLWRRSLSQPWFRPPIVVGDAAIVQGSGSGSTTWAFDLETGAQLWWGGVGDGVLTAAGEQVVGASCSTGGVRVSTGERLWSFSEGSSCSGGDASSFDGEWLWSHGGRIFDPVAGTIVRRFEGAPPSFARGMGVHLHEGALVGFDLATMTRRWRVPVPAGEIWSSSPLVLDDLVFITTTTGRVLAFELETGTEAWQGSAGARMSDYVKDVPSWGLAAGYGTLVVPTADGMVGLRAPAVAPETTITAAPDAVIASRSATVAFSSAAPGATFDCSLDGGAWAPCSSPRTVDGLEHGKHVFRVRAVVAGGTRDPTPAQHAWEVDVEGPSVTLDEGPPAVTASNEAALGFSSSDAGARFECLLDGAAWSSCAAPKRYAGLSLGSHEFAVRALDALGNVGAPASWSWIVSYSSGSAQRPPSDAAPVRNEQASEASEPEVAVVATVPSAQQPAAVSRGPRAPVVRLTLLPQQDVAAVLRAGLRVRVTASLRSRLTWTTTARAGSLRGRQRGRGRGSAFLSAERGRTLVLRVPRPAAGDLRRRRSTIALAVRLRATGVDGGTTTLDRVVVLRISRR